MKYAFFLISFILISIQNDAQGTYLGKRFVGGISAGRSIDKTYLGITTELALSGRWSAAVYFDKSVTQGKDFNLSTGLASPDHADYYVLSGTYNYDVKRLSLFFKKFYFSRGAAAPYGFYLCYLVNRDFVHIIRDDLKYHDPHYYNSPVITADKIGPKQYSVTSIGMGCGLSRIIGDKIVLGFLLDLKIPVYYAFPDLINSDIPSIVYKEMTGPFSNRNVVALHFNLGYLLF